MVSALDSGSSGPGSRPSWGHCVVWAGHFTLTMPLSTQEYKWVPANLTLRVILSSHPGGGGGNTPSRLMQKKPEISSCLMGH